MEGSECRLGRCLFVGICLFVNFERVPGKENLILARFILGLRGKGTNFREFLQVVSFV